MDYPATRLFKQIFEEPMKNKINGFSYAFIAVLVILSASLTILPGADNAEVIISQYVVTPRINLFNDPSVEQYQIGSSENQIHFRTQAEYRQTFGKRFAVSSVMEFASASYRYENPFRIHTLTGQFSLGKTVIIAGRQSLWNPLYQTRMDGVRIAYKILPGVRLSAAAGQIPSFIGADDLDTENIAQACLKLTRPSSSLSVNIWDRYSDEHHLRGGIIYSRSLNEGTRLTAYTSYDFDAKEAYYSRLHIQKYMDTITLYTGVRHKNAALDPIYPWIISPPSSTATAYVGASHFLKNDVTFSYRYVQRFTVKSRNYFKAVLQTRNEGIILLTGNDSDRNLVGGSLFATRKLTATLSLGGSISVNSLEIDGEPEPADATGAYAWMEFDLPMKLKIRIFGQYYRNPYFNIDGRGGIYVRYAF